MIEDVDPSILAPLSLEQVMKHCFEGCDWRRVFIGIKDFGKEQWRATYYKYLDSLAWRKKRNARLAIDGNRCTAQCCLWGDVLQVHHKTYDRIGDEDVENDLITLCDRCHKEEHERA